MRRLAVLALAALHAGAVCADRVVEAILDWEGLTRLSVLAEAPVTRVTVKAGDDVTAGQVLLETDTTVLEARRSAARAALEEARIRLAEAEREYHRNQELYDRTVLSQHDLQLAEAEWRAALNRFEAAKAEVVARERALAWSRIRAPFEGRVVAVHARPGEMIQTACRVPVLVEMAAADAMAAVFAWPPDRPPPESVKVVFLGRAHEAACRPEGSAEGAGRLRCRFRLAEDERARARAGMKAEVRVP